ncbi:hypothetical protein EDB83DRAFT_2312738 [Lactarius deliciosus]|nr:hypothetical protein EDB83DRAFT_2312738 [Lactarius deliciosus]
MHGDILTPLPPLAWYSRLEIHQARRRVTPISLWPKGEKKHGEKDIPLRQWTGDANRSYGTSGPTHSPLVPFAQFVTRPLFVRRTPSGEASCTRADDRSGNIAVTDRLRAPRAQERGRATSGGRSNPFGVKMEEESLRREHTATIVLLSRSLSDSPRPHHEAELSFERSVIHMIQGPRPLIASAMLYRLDFVLNRRARRQVVMYLRSQPVADSDSTMDPLPLSNKVVHASFSVVILVASSRPHSLLLPEETHLPSIDAKRSQTGAVVHTISRSLPSPPRAPSSSRRGMTPLWRTLSRRRNDPKLFTKRITVITVLAPEDIFLQNDNEKEERSRRGRTTLKSSVTLVLPRTPDHRTTPAHAFPTPFSVVRASSFSPTPGGNPIK